MKSFWRQFLISLRREPLQSLNENQRRMIDRQAATIEWQAARIVELTAAIETGTAAG